MKATIKAHPNARHHTEKFEEQDTATLALGASLAVVQALPLLLGLLFATVFSFWVGMWIVAVPFALLTLWFTGMLFRLCLGLFVYVIGSIAAWYIRRKM